MSMLLYLDRQFADVAAFARNIHGALDYPTNAIGGMHECTWELPKVYS